MATVLKSVQVTERHSLFLYASGAVILRDQSSKFGTLADQTLCELLGERAVSLWEEGQVLRAPKDTPKSKSKVKAATVNSTDTHRVDIMQAQLDSLAKTNAAILQMLQAQAQPKLIDMSK